MTESVYKVIELVGTSLALSPGTEPVKPPLSALHKPCETSGSQKSPSKTFRSRMGKSSCTGSR